MHSAVNKLGSSNRTYILVPEIAGSQSSPPSCCESQHHHSRAEVGLMTCEHHQLAGEPVHSSRAYSNVLNFCVGMQKVSSHESLQREKEASSLFCYMQTCFHCWFSELLVYKCILLVFRRSEVRFPARNLFYGLLSIKAHYSLVMYEYILSGLVMVNA